MAGIVTLQWAFAEDRKKRISITCHVLPTCTYDLILGNIFLVATKTMSKYRARLTQCLFPVLNKFASFNFLGETSQRLEGTLADTYNVLAVPDSGAERNVMDMQYAVSKNFHIRKNRDNRELVQLADGSYDITIGKVSTYWTFSSGERIPVTFVILKNCCSDIIIGETILTRHNVFEEHASSIVFLPYEMGYYELAPYDFIRDWQRPFRKLAEKIMPQQKTGTSTQESLHPKSNYINCRSRTFVD